MNNKFSVFEVLLFIIILIAGILRFTGINYSYPPYHPDEGITYSSALEMIKNSNLDPLRYDYPSLVPLVNAFFFKVFFIPLSWIKYYVSNLGPILEGMVKLPLGTDVYNRIFLFNIVGVREINALRWGRLITALTGVGIVFLVYVVGGRIFNKKTGIIAAFLTAVNYRQVLNSHLGLPDIYNAFFLLLSILVIESLLRKPTKARYLLAGISVGLYFSTKFQVFTIVLLLIVNAVIYFRENKPGLKTFVKSFFSVNLILALAAAALIFVVLNPYIFINFTKFIAIQSYQLLKYGRGTNQLDLYAISYLYHIGVGKTLSLLCLLGILLTFLKKQWKASFLILVILQFMFVFVYFTRGGFYTRNFVTVTPILLIFSGFAVSQILNLIKNGKINLLITFIFLLLICRNNIQNSAVLAGEYAKPWNYIILSEWLGKNINPGSKIAAHSSVPLPIENVERLPYDFSEAFSLDEFKKEGALYAIANFDIVTADFYWWMNRGGIEESLHFWNKPVDILEKTYSAMAIREISDYAIYSIFKKWQAPDSNFIVAKIPEYKVTDKSLVSVFDFDKDTNGWKAEGQLWYPETNARWEEGRLVLDRKTVNSPILGWKSLPIGVDGWSGFALRAKIRTESDIKNKKGSYLAISFYKNENDASLSKNRIGVRLTSRNGILNEWVYQDLAGEIPKNGKYMVVEFRSYDTVNTANLLDNLEVYKVNISVDLGTSTIAPVKVDNNIIFPNSHGYL